jgi:hypothetical protein
MPCHGDRGQGLTDEWREVRVEDHQNCWGRGCHTGKSEIDAFYLPRSVPAVSGSPGALGIFRTAEGLFAFLQETQPPQRPGALTEREYWALTAFSLLLFFVLSITGLIEMFIYVPWPEAAHESIRQITFLAPYGWLLRNLHFWAGQVMVGTVVLHMARVVFSGGGTRAGA